MSAPFFNGLRTPLTLRLSKGERELGRAPRAAYDLPREARRMAFWVDVLRCADASYYVGHTDNLELRVTQHQAGDLGGYTKSRRPVKLVYSESVATRDDAFAAERQLKGWSRQKKEALIAGDWDRLRLLAQRRSPSA